jgi:hypothetical protein
MVDIRQSHICHTTATLAAYDETTQFLAEEAALSKDRPEVSPGPQQFPLSDSAGLATVSLSEVKGLKGTRVASSDTVAAGIQGGDGTPKSPLQEFIDVVGPLENMYSRAVGNQNRVDTFQKRMEGVYEFDHQTFTDIGSLSTRMREGKIPPAEVGKEIGKILHSTLDRHAEPGKPARLDSDLLNVEGALSGVMLAARANFDQKNVPNFNWQTIQMAHAAEHKLSSGGGANVTVNFEVAPKKPGESPQVGQRHDKIHAIRYFDTQEPGLANVPARQRLRHPINFKPDG